MKAMTPELTPAAQEALEALVEEQAGMGRDPLKARAEALIAAQGMRAILSGIPCHRPNMPQSVVDVFSGRTRS
jgi:hypothetical protein